MRRLLWALVLWGCADAELESGGAADAAAGDDAVAAEAGMPGDDAARGDTGFPLPDGFGLPDGGPRAPDGARPADDAAPDDAAPDSDGAPPPPDAAPPSPDAAPPPPPPDAAPPPPPPPPDPGPPPVCRWPVEVVFYTASDWNRLTDALAADASRCASFHVSIPAPADAKTEVRGGVLDAMRARGPQFKAMAEFHWGGWSRVDGMSWYDKGVEFRRRMAAAGYDPGRGETWAINELPSSVRDDAATRRAVRDVVRGLYEGPPGAQRIKGAVFVINMGHATMNFAVYKPKIQAWLRDADFWVDVANAVRWWAQEVYVDPRFTCVDDTTVAQRAARINAFAMHVPRLAGVGPDAVNTAQSYLGRAYVPLLNAVWNSETGFGDTRISLENMQHHVSGQVYAARAWAEDHAYPDGRVGFAWDRNQNAPEAMDALARRLASSLRHAYAEGADGGRAAGACSPNHAFTWCQCATAGARFNEGWETFGAW